MKIIVTGASGTIGKKLVPLLRSRYEVITVQRTGGDISWKLGEMPVELIDIPLSECTFLHLAWETKNREANRHLNVGGTIALAHFLKTFNVPLIFMSTYSVRTDSIYGKSKLEAEQIIQLGATVLRSGLVPECSPYLKTHNSLGISLWGRTKIPITTLEHLFVTVVNLIENPKSGEIMELVEYFTKMKSLLPKHTRFVISIPTPLIRWALRFLSLFSQRARDLIDGLKSLEF